MRALSDEIAAALKDPVNALAAAFVIAHHHDGLLDWVANALRVEEPPPARSPRGSNGHAKRRRPARRDTSDQALVDAMQSSPGATIADLARAIGKNRSSVVSALNRLRVAGLTENASGKWRLTEEPVSRETARWVAPIRGHDRSAVSHLT